MIYIECPDLSENKFVSFYTTIRNKTFKMSFKWNEYCDCCFMSIFDSDGNEIRTGIALCTDSVIHTDKRVLPEMAFVHKDGLTLSPTANSIKDYVILYEDTTE